MAKGLGGYPPPTSEPSSLRSVWARLEIRGEGVRVLTTLREALNDKRLLGKALVGPSWHAWRTILLATMGEPLTDDELVTFQEVTGREQAPTTRCEELSR